MKLLKNMILPIFIFLFAILSCDSPEVKERERVVELLDRQFDLPAADRCAINFSMEKNNHNGVVLFAEACSLLDKQKLSSKDILTPDNLTLIKNAHFEKLEIYQHGIRVEVVEFKQNSEK